MSEDKNKTPLYYPRKMRTGWCVAHEVTAAGVTIERYGIHCQTVCGSIPAGGSDEPETRGGSGSGARRDRSRGSHRFAGTVRLRREGGGWL